MHMDGAALLAAAYTMQKELVGARIDRITMPSKLDIVLFLRGAQGSRKLLLSAEPEAARSYILEQTEQGPSTPFPFLMVLRKHLVPGKITGISLTDTDRVLVLDIQSVNEIGQVTNFRLIAEIMGKHSNIILVSADGTIVDSIKRIPPSVSSFRTVLPGTVYKNPPAQEKIDPLKTDAVSLADVFENGTAQQALVKHVFGVSPFLAEQICLKANISPDRLLDRAEAVILADTCIKIFSDIQNGKITPCIVKSMDNETAVLPFRPVGYEYHEFDEMNKALEAFYSKKLKADLLSREKGTLTRLVTEKLNKQLKKLSIQRDTIQASSDAENIRLEGELITAYAYLIKKGDTAAEVYDYINNRQTTLRLDPTISPHQNAARRFKRYNKLKASKEAATKQAELIKGDVDYLESVLNSIEQAETLDDIQDIKDELVSQGVISQPREKKKQASTSAPLRFVSTDGVEILSGRNNTQNDLLTTRIAKSTDTWLHAQGIPGSHVIIRTASVSQKTLLEAAHIAAFFSKARRSQNVPVDYTLVKNVRKPAGSKPGHVIYTQQKTLFITPDEALVKSLIRE